jgi:hypothetical protein
MLVSRHPTWPFSTLADIGTPATFVLHQSYFSNTTFLPLSVPAPELFPVLCSILEEAKATAANSSLSNDVKAASLLAIADRLDDEFNRAGGQHAALSQISAVLNNSQDDHLRSLLRIGDSLELWARCALALYSMANVGSTVEAPISTGQCAGTWPQSATAAGPYGLAPFNLLAPLWERGITKLSKLATQENLREHGGYLELQAASIYTFALATGDATSPGDTAPVFSDQNEHDPATTEYPGIFCVTKGETTCRFLVVTPATPCCVKSSAQLNATIRIVSEEDVASETLAPLSAQDAAAKLLDSLQVLQAYIEPTDRMLAMMQCVIIDCEPVSYRKK